MKIARYKDKTGAVKYGVVEGDRVRVADGDPLRGLKSGDVFEVEVAGIGVLRNPITKEN